MPERAILESDQCEGMTARGRCPFKHTPNSAMCEMHNGNMIEKSLERKRVDLYKINKYQEKMRHISGHPDMRSLHNEIALLRIMIEDRFNMVNEENDLLIHGGAIADLISKVNVSVMNMNKLEEKLGVLLSKEQAETFVDVLLTIIQEEVTDADTIVKIANRVAQAFNGLSNNSETV